MASSPNTQPLYTRDIINWDTRLVDQIAGRKLTVESPVFMGQFGAFGGVIWSIRAVPLGANVATNLRIYGKKENAPSVTDYRLLFEVSLPPINDMSQDRNSLITSYGNSTVSAPPAIEIPLPRIYTRNTEESRGMVREGNYAFYCALSVPVASGWDVFVEGGNY